LGFVGSANKGGKIANYNIQFVASFNILKYLQIFTIFSLPGDMANMPAVKILAPLNTAIPHATSIITSWST